MLCQSHDSTVLHESLVVSSYQWTFCVHDNLIAIGAGGKVRVLNCSQFGSSAHITANRIYRTRYIIPLLSGSNKLRVAHTVDESVNFLLHR